MNKQISSERLQEIIKNAQEETTGSFAEKMEEFFQPKSINLDDFISTELPKLLGKTLVVSRSHSEKVIYDVLKELDLLKND